jgi:hypothetical protein
MKIYVKAAIDDPPHEGDIFDIIIIDDDIVEGASGKRESNLNELYGKIRNLLDNLARQGKVVKDPDGKFTGGKTHYFPFQVIAPDGKAYPESRRFKIRITYPLTSTGIEHEITLRPGEQLTDFETIFIRDDQKEFRQAVTLATEFVDKKIHEVNDRYKTDPDTMSEI